ncbi:MAG: peptidylprolyl isomerase [Candidatus Latescibacteria bacterium]|nr:peptidylprolyl isomerase [Candidatus Latescibacterota bacterium]
MRSLGTLVFGFILILVVGGGIFLFLGGSEQGVIETAVGTIVIEFFPGDAPNHVKNWKKLARMGFYDGTTFHRTVPGFMIQGGDPNSMDDDPYNDGAGGPGWNVDAEFNDRKHLRGIVSMARGLSINSAGSQFFICLDDLPWLDRQYTIFGEVVKGMGTVDAIIRRPRDPNNPERPLRPIPMTRVYVRTVYRLPLIGEFSF